MGQETGGGDVVEHRKLLPVDPDDRTEGGRYCGARTKATDAKHMYCHRNAGWGTDHVGAGKCKLHGGCAPVRSGRYSDVMHVRLRELFDHFKDDPEPLNILAEIAMGRALFVDFIERYETMRDALLAWHESYEATKRPIPEDLAIAFNRVIDEWEDHARAMGEKATETQLADIEAARRFVDLLRGANGAPSKPRIILDIADAHKILGGITRDVERVEKVAAANAISRQEFRRLTDAMAAVVMKNVTDQEALKRIRDGWLDEIFLKQL